MMNVMVDTSKVENVELRVVNASGDDLESLLQNFLEQFLILMDAENLFMPFVKKVSIQKAKGEYVLNAEVLGDDAGNYETVGPQVKAVTYNDMEVTEKMAQVVVDI